ncbi:MAG: trigger factor [Candidatus Magasanikbacteria bacterium]|nr:trigger factor [Candidatus Magasanikbacteria bacterium]
MNYSTKKLENSQVEMKITVEPSDMEEHLKKAATKLSERTAIKGFRKGKAPFDVVKKELGEMAILQEALESIVQHTFYDAIKKEELETIGMPKIEIEKIAPDNDLVYKATVALLPNVKLPEINNIKVVREVKKVEDKQVDETLDALRGMQAKEVIKEGKAEGTDKLVLDMNMSIDKVPVEGGQSKDHQVYLSEKHYIPGFNEQVKGLKKGDEKEFTLDFPKDHYQKNLAGKKVDINVKVKDVFERQLPEMTDEFAKTLGQESVSKLKELIKNNMLQEAETKADQKVEIEILDKLIDKADFEPIPDVLIDAERQKMFYELKSNLEKQGIPIKQYLEDIKKDEKQLFEDFKQQAEKRAKAALVSRQIAKEKNIHVHDEEIDKEIKMMEEMYKDNPQYLENIKRPEVRDTIAMTIQNKKVMDWLKAKIIEGKELDMGCDHGHDEHKNKDAKDDKQEEKPEEDKK